MSDMYIKDLGINLRTSDEHRQASGRITRQQMLGLKALDASMKKWALLSALRTALANFLDSVSLLNAKKATPMCRNYGHVIKEHNWKGYWPICADCGTTITDPAMLRKSAVVLMR